MCKQRVPFCVLGRIGHLVTASTVCRGVGTQSDSLATSAILILKKIYTGDIKLSVGYAAGTGMLGFAFDDDGLAFLEASLEDSGCLEFNPACRVHRTAALVL